MKHDLHDDQKLVSLTIFSTMIDGKKSFCYFSLISLFLSLPLLLLLSSASLEIRIVVLVSLYSYSKLDI